MRLRQTKNLKKDPGVLYQRIQDGPQVWIYFLEQTPTTFQVEPLGKWQ